jgi:hypothetical protein
VRWSLLLPSVVAGCALLGPSAHDTLATAGPGALPDLELAPPASPRRTADDAAAALSTRIDDWFAGHGTRRLHVQLDRPLYRPGESVWLKTWNVASRGLAATEGGGITIELVDPRGSVVETKLLLQQGGTATNDVTLPADAPGGRWTLRATLATGEVDERPFVVSSYEAPRIHKTLDFVREAYGPGERVEALVELTAADGTPLAGREVRGMLQVDGATVVESTFTTDATGAVLVAGDLPATLASGDGLLTVLVDDGGVTESISRSVPIVLADLRLTFFPEGGDLVTGLPGRVYFEAQDRHGEPADTTFVVEDERGAVVATAESVHDGLGRFSFTPERGRRYRARVTAPAGVDASFPLPDARAEGCALRAYDDVRSETSRVRVGLRCTSAEQLTVVSVLREAPLDAAAVSVVPGRETVVYLATPPERAREQGAVRVTAFDHDLRPLAERLVYRNAGRNLKVELTPDREQYGPRDEVRVKVRTTGPDGEPVPAELALSVVDDAVLGLADDEEGNLLTRMYLEPEVVESPDDPAWYFDAEEPLAARGLDLVLGTKGWRRFEWERVWAPDPEPVLAEVKSVTEDAPVWRRLAALVPQARPAPIPQMAGAPVWAEPPADAPVAEPEAPMAMPAMQARAEPARDEKELRAPAKAKQDWRLELARGADNAGKRERQAERADLDDLGYFGGVAMDWEGPMGGELAGWAPVRVFPRPEHGPGFTGVRTDFRDTVHWEPTLRTGADGTAEVAFLLSDAVTTFRITAEGLGGGAAAHAEATLTSVLPVSLATKLPPAVSVGDELLLPVTVTNSRPGPLEVALSTSLGSPVLTTDDLGATLRVDGRGASTRFVPIHVGSGRETVELRLTAEGGGLADTLVRSVDVVPAGFPRTWSAAGELERTATHTFVLDEVVPHSLVASVQWHPSPVATLVSGLEGLISTPGGCFEQTSSTNWPNVSILKYLEAHDGDPRIRAQSGAALETGYGILTGYQVQDGGFETWGSGPGKEALSAFGLLEFADMAHVYPVKPAVLERNASYLLSARDGRGGFTNTGESAHGYGSAPKPVLDGFITWALVATGHADAIPKELAQQAETARTSSDPYVLALAARTLVRTRHPGADAAVARLAALQAADGSFPGAESSITRSYEANLDVESTALAASTLLEARRMGEAERAVDWLVAHRQGAGTWGATQATALALEALTAHAELAARPRTGGRLQVEVNGAPAGTLAYEADQTAPLVLDGLADVLKAGTNRIVLRHEGGEPLPYTVDVRWTALEPTSAPGAELRLTTALDRAVAPMGETVRLTARLENRTGKVVPSPIARIGLPAGLEPQLWQLKELQERGVVAFYETRPREVTLYWDGQHGDEVHEVNLDLLAAVPGTFTGPASSAWPYYDDDERSWAKGLRATVTPR